MQIAKDSVVKLHYTLYDDDGLELDSSVGKRRWNTFTVKEC